jgi:hypothetical protein
LQTPRKRPGLVLSGGVSGEEIEQWGRKSV